MVGYDDDVGRAVHAVEAECRDQFAQTCILRPQAGHSVGAARAVAVLDVVRGAEPDQGQHRLLVGQDVLGEHRHHVLVGCILGRTLGGIGGVARRDGNRTVGVVGRRIESDVAGAIGRVAVIAGQRDCVGARVAFDGVGRNGIAVVLQFGDQAARHHGVLVQEVAAPSQILNVGRAGLADGGGHHAGALRGGEQRLHQQQLAAVVVVERGQDLVVLGEHRILVILAAAAGAVADRNGVGTALRRGPEGVAVEAAGLGKGPGGKGRPVHHGESRVGRVVVAEVGPGLTQCVQVGRVGGSYRVRTQAVPYHDDGAGRGRRGRNG